MGATRSRLAPSNSDAGTVSLQEETSSDYVDSAIAPIVDRLLQVRATAQSHHMLCCAELSTSEVAN